MQVRAPNAQLTQLAAALDQSPRIHTLKQRQLTLQKKPVVPATVAPGDQPVIQRKTEIDYKVQQVGYQDSSGQMKTEIVGHVADAFIDVSDPVVGAEPDSQKQQKPMYDRLKAVYGTGPFIRGHLLNGNLGGVGEVYNLFPITSHANGEHKRTAEGQLKKYTRAELDAKKNGLTGPHFIRYKVTAVPANGADLTANADAEFQCEMIGAHSLRTDRSAETWIIPSKPGAKVVATGERTQSQDYSNSGLGHFGSGGKGESAQTLVSRMRSTVNGWGGDQNFKFAVGGLSAHVDLSAAKEKFLTEFEDELDKDPIYDDYYGDAVDKAQDLMQTVYDQSQLAVAIQQIIGEAQAWALNARKTQFLEKLRYQMIFVDLPEKDQEDIYKKAVQDITPVTSITSLEQSANAYLEYVKQQVKHIQEQQNAN